MKMQTVLSVLFAINETLFLNEELLFVFHIGVMMKFVISAFNLFGI